MGTKRGKISMTKLVRVFDEAREIIEQESDNRIKQGWKRGMSMEQIASEAIIFWAAQGNAGRFKDINDREYILKHGGKPADEELTPENQEGDSP